MSYNTKFVATLNGVQQDLGNIIYNWSSNTINISTTGVTYQRYPIRYKKPTIILDTDINATMDGYPNFGDQVITFGPQIQGRYVVMGTGTSAGAAFSNEGVVVNPITNVPSNVNSGINWDGTKWYGIINGNLNATSADGSFWQPTGVRTTVGAGGYARKTLYNGSIYVMTMYNPTAIIAYSYDGINWITATSYTSAGAIGYGLSWNGVVWMSGNQSGSPLGYSYNGINWVAVSGASTFFPAGCSDIIWIGNRWIAAGWGSGNFPGTSPRLAFTTDPIGATGWTAISLTSYATGIGITSLAWNNKLITSSGGWNDKQAYSIDNIIWITSNSYINIYSGAVDGSIRWNGQLFLQGATGSPSVSYSYDGMFYAASTGNSQLTRVSCIEYNVRRPHSITFQKRITIATIGGAVAGNTLMYSYDGITWTGLGTSIFSTAAYTSAFNGRIWVAGGEGGNTLAVSNDGISWRGIGSQAFTTSCNDIVWNNVSKTWLAGGQGTRSNLQYSFDGYTWIPVATSPFSTACNGFAYTSSLTLAVGSGVNTLASTTNGSIWTPLGRPLNTITLNGIATNGSLWVAVGNTITSGNIIYSYNGSNWRDTGYTGFSTTGSAIAWNGTMWVAVGTGTRDVAYSYNGIQWTNGTKLFNSTSNISNMGYWIQWNGSVWIAGGQSIGNSISYSFDGINWRVNNIAGITQNIYVSSGSWTETSAPSQSWNGITSSSSGQYLAAIVNNGGIWTNSNYGAGSWTQTTAINLPWISIASSSSGQYLAAAVNEYLGVNNGIHINSNYGSGTWTRQFTSPGIECIASSSSGQYLVTAQYNSFIYINSNYGSGSWTQQGISEFWMGVGSNSSGQYLVAGTSSSIYVNSNYGAGTWTEVLIINSSNWRSFACSSSGQYIAATSNSGLYTNSNFGNGSWTKITAVIDPQNVVSDSTGQYLTVLRTNFNGIVRNSNYGNGTWQDANAPNAQYNKIASDSTGGYIVITRSPGAILTNTTITITNVNTICTSVSSNYNVQPKTFIQHPTLAFGSSGFAYSTDGISWTALGATIFTNQTRKAFWSGSMWIAGGSGGSTLAYSYDGTSWTSIGSSVITSQVNGIAYNGQIWVAAGNSIAGGPTIAYSTNGINWTGVTGSSTIFTNAGYGVTWNGTAWLATGHGENTIAVSTNGITWTSVSNSNRTTTGTVYSATNGSLWVVPVNSSVGLMYSSDTTGLSGWTNVTTSPFSTGGLCVTYNGSIWVAGGAGTNTIAYSSNGITWTGISTAFSSVNDIVWNGTRFVATGGQFMGYSPDGITWYVNNTSNIFTTGFGLASNPGVGAFTPPSALVLDDNGITGNSISASNTLEIVSSDPYFQSGFSNITVKIDSDNVY